MSSRKPSTIQDLAAVSSSSSQTERGNSGKTGNVVSSAEAGLTSLNVSSEASMLPAHFNLMWELQRCFNGTLERKVLWRQTVQQLRQGLGLSGCFAYGYESGVLRLLAISEGAQEILVDSKQWSSGVTLDAHEALVEALAQHKPFLVEKARSLLAGLAAGPDDSVEDGTHTISQVGQNTADLEAEPLILLVPVTHLGAPRGLLLLHRPAAYLWTTSEKRLLEGIGGSLGAAIAHSAAQQNNQALAQKFQQVEAEFLSKHREIEEAHQEVELAYQEAEEASRLKSEFLANTSHELRTPLNGMIGFLKLVIDGMADTEEELHEFVGEAHNSALLLLDIINDILDVAKIEAGKMELDLSIVQLNELFDDVSQKTRRQALARNLLYEITPPQTHDEVIVYGDYQRLLQVLLNLVGNALKFTHSGSITISSRIIEKPVLVNDEDMPGLLEIRVADTGIGVSLDQQAKLFKSFSQVDGSRTRQYGGTGLGLVISQKLVEAMGGEVHFYSMGEELGSTVTFTVPLYQMPVMKKSSTESDLEESEMGTM